LKSGIVVEMKVDQYTAEALVSRAGPLPLRAGSTLYLIFQLVPRSGDALDLEAGQEFAPRSVSREKALEIARGLTPVGMAAREPIN
jgi:hypothetical protein